MVTTVDDTVMKFLIALIAGPMMDGHWDILSENPSRS
jgi:hypothetical protein